MERRELILALVQDFGVEKQKRKLLQMGRVERLDVRRQPDRGFRALKLRR